MISYHLPLGESNLVEIDHIWDKSFYKNADALMANGILDFAVYVAFFFFFFLMRNAKQCSTIKNTTTPYKTNTSIGKRTSESS